MLVNSGEFDGLPAPEGGRRIVERLAAEGRGRFADQLPPARLGLLAPALLGLPDPGRLLRDATGSSRCRTTSCRSCCPDVEDYKPKGQPPLAQAEDWVERAVPALRRPGAARDRDDGHVRRLVLVLPPLLRPGQRQAPFDRELVDYWNPVDLYIGGVDHATMHMIYARFWTKVLNDLGYVGFREPFASFFSNGWVTTRRARRSRSAPGNVVGPGRRSSSATAPTPCRLCILFLGPADQDMEWTRGGGRGRCRGSSAGCGGSSTRSRRARRRASRRTAPLARKAHETIAKVTDDIGRRFAFNTAISAVMELVERALAGHATAADARFAAETAVSLIQPYAPHVAEELWQRLGARAAVGAAVAGRRPGAARARRRSRSSLQVNGKLRDRLAGAGVDRRGRARRRSRARPSACRRT